MLSITPRLGCLLVCLFAVQWQTARACGPGGTCAHPESHSAPAAGLRFEENLGQWDGPFRFRANLGSAATVFVEDGRLGYLVLDPALTRHNHEGGLAAAAALPDSLAQHEYVSRWVAHGLPLEFGAHFYTVTFQGATPGIQPVGEAPYPDPSHYFLGNDPARWARNVQGFAQTRYMGLYPGIDLALYGKDGSLKYDFEVQPGADPRQIRLRFDGQERLTVTGSHLTIHTSVGPVQEGEVEAWQTRGAERIPLVCQFARVPGTDNQVQFVFPNGYDATLPIVIDPPVLVFSTYSGSTADNWGFTATYDDDANYYGGGLCNGVGYPGVVGSYDVTFNGGGNTSSNNSLFYSSDIVITKLNPTGTQRLYSTYIGGTNNEQPHSLWADSQGRLYGLGTTRSGTFPTTAGVLDASFNGGVDIVTFRLSANGSQLERSTFIGSTGDDGVNLIDISFSGANPLYNAYADDARGEIVVDEATGRVYLATCTRSAAGFPLSPSGYVTTFGGAAQMGAVVCLDTTLSSLVFGTLMGSPNAGALSACYSMKVNSLGRPIVVGGTTSGGGFVGGAGVQPAFGGGTADGFVAILAPGGNALENYTYVGTNQYDQTFLIDIDHSDSVYIMGQTAGFMAMVNSPIGNANAGQYVTKLTPNLGTVVYRTRFGPNNNTPCLTPTAFLVDICQNVYVSGWGGSLANGGSTTTGFQTTANAFRTTTDGNDFYIVVFEKNVQSLLFATFYGNNGGGGDHVDGGTSRFDELGVVYQNTCASCGGSPNNFPVQPANVVGPNNLSTNCNMGMFKYQMDLITQLQADADVSIQTNQGCVPFTATFTNQTQGATSYLWHFGDSANTTSTVQDTSFVYTTPGTYFITLEAFSNDPCVLPGSTTIQVDVFPNPVVDFEINYPDCEDLTINLLNQTTGGSGSFLWDFGDGSTSTSLNPTHTYAQPGLYDIKLIANPGSPCADSMIVSGFRVRLYPVPDVDIDSAFCSMDISVLNSTAFADTFVWEISDGTTFTTPNFNHTFAAEGTFEIILTALPGNICEIKDTFTVVIDTSAIVGFQYERDLCTRDVQLEDLSQNVVTREWALPDGSTPTTTNPSFSFTGPGWENISLTINAGTFCERTLTEPIYSHYLAEADFAPDAPPCQATASLINSSTESETFNWSIPNVGTSTDANPVFTFPATGTYPVTLITNADSLCPDTLSLDVFIQIQTTAAFDMPDTTCFQEVTILNQSTNQVAEQWTVLRTGNPTPVDIFATLPPTYTFPGPGTYEVVMQTNPGGACPDEARDTILVSQFSPAEFVPIPSGRCALDHRFVSFVADTVPVLWFFGDGTTSTDVLPTHTYNTDGTYTVTLITNPQDICPDTASRALWAGREYVAAFALPDSICGNTISPTGVTENAASFHWQWGDGTPGDTIRTPTHTYAQPGVYTVIFTVDEGTACESADTQTVVTREAPLADFSIASWDCNGVLNLSNESQNAVRYLWQFSDGTTSDEETPVKLFGTAGRVSITLIVDAANGCQDTLREEFSYDPTAPGPIMVPNVFTPNGDGVNDYFSLYGTNYACVEAVSIFDRWGVLIFTSNDPDFRWYGHNQNNDKLVPEGVYVYVLHLHNDTERAGTVTVLR